MDVVPLTRNAVSMKAIAQKILIVIQGWCVEQETVQKALVLVTALTAVSPFPAYSNPVSTNSFCLNVVSNYKIVMKIYKASL